MTGTSMPLAPKANPRMVLLGFVASAAVCAIPFTFKAVRDKEQQIAELRDSQYEKMDAKSAARNQRLSLSGGKN